MLQAPVLGAGTIHLLMSGFQPPIKAEGITHLPHKIVAFFKNQKPLLTRTLSVYVPSFMANPSHQATVTKNKSGRAVGRLGERRGQGIDLQATPRGLFLTQSF